jgi:hypothetical protein
VARVNFNAQNPRSIAGMKRVEGRRRLPPEDGPDGEPAAG